MALVRCEECGKPKGRTRKYIREVKPLNYPDTTLICGSAGCTNPGMVWLEAHEWRQYTDNKKRIFEPHSYQCPRVGIVDSTSSSPLCVPALYPTLPLLRVPARSLLPYE